MLADDAASPFSHLRGLMDVGQEPTTGAQEFAFVAHLKGPAGTQLPRGHVRKIVHVWAEEYRLATGRRLDRILAPFGNKTSTDHRNVGESVLDTVPR